MGKTSISAENQHKKYLRKARIKSRDQGSLR
ncbi:uncharacterized protein METZ01_LOCUS60737 [marine metagenome]|uniref:Uncharacterized protein n=1 Tax=marine metagenome TaxID=408172 RepID=A0A381T2I9_9ZZZZ